MSLLICLGVSGLGPVACDGSVADPSAVSLAQSSYAIRNGTRDPQTIALTDGEVLAIGWLHAPGQHIEPFCTGTFVTGAVVLTAAHCLRDKAPEQVAFSVGVLTETPKATFVVGQMFTHPSLDLGVLYLKEDARAQLPGLQPIQPNLADLSKVTDRILGSPAETAGYGYTWDPALSGRFFAALDVTDITDEHVVVNGNGLQGLCQGDSGAPLLVPGATGAPILIGIEERGEESCLGQDWMVRVDLGAEWLRPALGDEKKADSFSDPNAVPAEVRQQNTPIHGCAQAPAGAPLWALLLLASGLRRRRQP